MSEQGDPPVVVLDVETTMRCPIGNNLASPHWPENKVVLFGGMNLRDERAAIQNSINLSRVYWRDNTCIVAHNSAFDTKYALKEKLIPDLNQLSRLNLWDTQIAEYLLTGQKESYPTLDYCAEKRGGVLKNSDIAEHFASGKGADTVEPAKLKAYLIGDLENTAKVFWSQYTEAFNNNMLPLMHSQMDARQATIEMEWNGLKIDYPLLEQMRDQAQADLQQLKALLEQEADAICPAHELDPTSPTQLSKLLFGGEVKVVEDVQEGFFKNGNPKFRKRVRVDKISGYGIKPIRPKDGRGNYSTSDEVLQELLDVAQTKPLFTTATGDFIRNVQKFRETQKQLSTYFQGLLDLVFPDGYIHPNFNHCVTGTGRLSSSNPNLQNITNGEVKKAFVSRWGDDGFILEADYSQLEMVMLAVLSDDKQLMKDILDGVDMHTELFRQMYGRTPTKEERKWFKRCSFALVYGAGAGGIAQQSGLTKALAKKFISVFYTRYPGVEKWHEELAKMVQLGRFNDGLKDAESGIPCGESLYVSPFSNRRYHFREYVLSKDMQKWKKKVTDFSPTEIKNYPVQGAATGDIVPMMVGKLYRALRSNPVLRDFCLLINTVHDSIVLDVHKDVLHEACREIKRVLEDAPRYIKETFNYDFPLPLKVGISYGKNWLNQTEADASIFSAVTMKEAA